MQLEAIKHQGSRTSGQIDPKDAGKRSNEIVAERNKMAVKQVQRISVSMSWFPTDEVDG